MMKLKIADIETVNITRVVCSLMGAIGLHCTQDCEQPPYNHYGHQ